MDEHLLIVKAGAGLWALPMEAVEQTFRLDSVRRCRAGSATLVHYRGTTLELHDLAAALGEPTGENGFGVVLWAGGQRRVFSVDTLVGQMSLDQQPMPAEAGSRYCRRVTLYDGVVVPIVEPGVVCRVWALHSENGLGYTDMQRSALAEVANIGCGRAATALSELLGKPVNIAYTETLLATLAEAADRIGAATEQSAVIDTPIAEDGGKVLLLFPEDAATQLCALLGVSAQDEMGLSALKEVGNILASSYLNAIVEMTGLSIEPEPPEIEVDLLGHVLERRLTAGRDPSDPAILMRSSMTVEASETSFAFLFVPQFAEITQLLGALGLATPAAA